jgi:predicted RNA-binding Zn-ribbon protein involved in translation (DUF1610 family)
MDTDCTRVEFEVPRGQVVVRHAKCPNGHDLMDTEVKIDDHAAITLVIELGGKKGTIHLDPVYGSFNNTCDMDIPEKSMVNFFCPTCQESLKEDESCSKCSAPLFVLQLPGGGLVEGCTRNGCNQHNMRIVSGEQQMNRLFNEIGMDSFL